jgi:DNA modification methylase
MFQIFNTDIMSHLLDMPDESVDLAVFDPPYPTISGGSNDGESGNWERPGGMLTKNDGRVFEMNDIPPEEYLPDLWRVLKPQAHVYMMCNLLGLRDGLLDVVQREGFEVHNLLPWIKNNVTPNRWYMKNVEYTLFMRKGPAFSIMNKGSKTAAVFGDHPLDWPNPTSPKPHPTAKPVSLMKTYIENSSKPGDVVFDLFMGAGSTGVAAIDCGRQFIGVEADVLYYNIAKQRMESHRPRRTLTAADEGLI